MTINLRAGIVVLAVGLGSGCSVGAETGTLSGFPPPAGPGPGNTSGSEATFGDPTAGDARAGDCCLANGSPGCDDQFIESCVCADEVSCCSTEWTAQCAAAVDTLACGQCGAGPQDTGDVDPDSGPGGQDCCAGGLEPGCNDPAIEACVCSEIAFCCDEQWEPVCGDAVDALGCGHCEGAGDTGGKNPPPPGDTGGEPPPPPPPPMGGCCEPQMGPGCTDAAIQDCVCMQDAYCCDTEWDQLCVDQVAEFNCGDCGGGNNPPPPPPGGSPCCSAQPGVMGCAADPAVEACVCAIDDFCCTTEWDLACSVFVELFLCGTCS
ncbi:MAG: hypothetical protein K0V04_18240 [Deltaproteobacteria bacterium]|nr:hypothetical protein [Deltaproteobacteria bacterium]